jgi:hypothetical protein
MMFSWLSLGYCQLPWRNRNEASALTCLARATA